MNGIWSSQARGKVEGKVNHCQIFCSSLITTYNRHRSQIQNVIYSNRLMTVTSNPRGCLLPVHLKQKENARKNPWSTDTRGVIATILRSSLLIHCRLRQSFDLFDWLFVLKWKNRTQFYLLSSIVTAGPYAEFPVWFLSDLYLCSVQRKNDSSWF